MKARIGYWGIPGRVSRPTTHIVTGYGENQKNFCGWRPHRKAAFLFCAPIGAQMPQCLNCRFQWELHHPDVPLVKE